MPEYTVRVVKEEMSDGGVAHNVELLVDDQQITFACECADHARELTEMIDRCSWVETGKPT